MAPFPISSAVASMDLIRRPLRDLLRQLPSLPVTAAGAPDFADPDLLVSLAESGELTYRSCMAGFRLSDCANNARSATIDDGMTFTPGTASPRTGRSVG